MAAIARKRRTIVTVAATVESDSSGAVDVPDGRVLVSVRDEGVGIPTADLGRIFERFYKVDRARVRGKGGTGLGLAIARHIVESHGGRIWVESEEGAGSTFRFTIPVASSPVGAGADPADRIAVGDAS